MGNSACQHALECNIHNPNIRLDQHRLQRWQRWGTPVHSRRCAPQGHLWRSIVGCSACQHDRNATSTNPISGWTSTGLQRWRRWTTVVPLLAAGGAPRKGTLEKASCAFLLVNMLCNATSTIPISGWTSKGLQRWRRLTTGVPLLAAGGAPLKGTFEEASWAVLLANMVYNATSTIPISGWTSTGLQRWRRWTTGVPLFTADGAPLKGTLKEHHGHFCLPTCFLMQHPQSQYQAGPAQVFNAGGAGRRGSPCSQPTARP